LVEENVVLPIRWSEVHTVHDSGIIGDHRDLGTLPSSVDVVSASVRLPPTMSVANVTGVHEVSLGRAELEVGLECFLVGALDHTLSLPQMQTSVYCHGGCLATLKLAPLAAGAEKLEEEIGHL
jgi:hypothetical protein